MKEYLNEKTFYKYRNIQDAIEILESNTMYFNSPSQFNDPFEFNDRLLSFDFSEKFIKRKYYESLKALKALNYNGHICSLKDYGHLYKESVIEFLEINRNNVGVFCGSEIFDSTLMWSHYASNHKGICIGYKFPQTKEFLNDFWGKERIIANYVNYIDEILQMPCEVNNILFPDETLIHMCFTKSKVWEYEKEIRLLKFSGKGKISFCPTWINEIHFGLFTPPEDIYKVLAIIKGKHKNCKLYNMKFEGNSFRLKSIPFKI